MKTIRTLASAFILFAVLSTTSVSAADLPKVSFKSPSNGATVSSPVKVGMAAEGIKVAPAGEVKEGEGHHHIIVDGGPVAKGEVIIADATHIHFGKAQTEAEVPLTPGKHTLTLQFADGAHRSYGPELSSTIEITVK